MPEKHWKCRHCDRKFYGEAMRNIHERDDHKQVKQSEEEMGRKLKPGKVYSFKENRFVPDEVARVGADVVGEAIEAAIGESGSVDKRVLVENARPAKAPLHPCFEWNDPKAAELYRLGQARNIVNAVTVKIEGHEVAAFPSVSVQVESESGMIPQQQNIRVAAMLNDAELRHQKINEVLAKLMRLRKEYTALNELSIVWRAIDEVAK